MCILGGKYLWVLSEGAPFSHVLWKREEAVNYDLPDLQVRGRKHLQNPQAAAAEQHNSNMPLQQKTAQQLALKKGCLRFVAARLSSQSAVQTSTHCVTK